MDKIERQRQIDALLNEYLILYVAVLKSEYKKILESEIAKVDGKPIDEYIAYFKERYSAVYELTRRHLKSNGSLTGNKKRDEYLCDVAFYAKISSHIHQQYKEIEQATYIDEVQRRVEELVRQEYANK